MRKLLTIGIVSLLVLAIGSYSCSRDRNLSHEDSSAEIALRAQKFFESEIGFLSLPYKANENSPTTRAEMQSILGGTIEPDWQNARVWTVEQDVITEVPALLTRSICYQTMIEERDDTVSLTLRPPHTRIRIVERADSMFSFVITFLPDESYDGEVTLLESNPEGSDYSGITVYSRPDGTPEWGWRYKNGEIVNKIWFDAEYENLADPNVNISIGFGSLEPITRTQVIIEELADGTVIIIIVIEPVVCTPPKPSGGGGGGEPPYFPPPPPPPTDQDYGGGGSNGNNNNNGSNNDDYLPLDLDSDLEQEPCRDAVNNKANPVVDMELAPPSVSNIAGATFGDTRKYSDGRPKMHNGIDLAGEVGTPVYSQFGGTIGKVVDEQPNRPYPAGYSGDKDGGGNRIYVNSTINGQSVSNGYWHLRADTPIANNPRTGLPWATGDTINAGELIGYIGVTGNASPDVPHLHLSTKVDGVKADPTTYLNATVSTSTTDITTPCD